MKNIWMFHHYATPPNMSGLTRPYDFSKELLKQGYKSTVFSSAYLHYTNENLIKENALYKYDDKQGVPFVFIKTFPYKGNGMSRVKNMVSFFINLFKVTKQYAKTNGKPDVIIASSPHPLTMLAGILIAKRYKIPCICEVRDFWPEVFFLGGKLKRESIAAKVLLSGEHWIYKKANALIFLKEGDVNYIKEQGWDRDIDLKKCHYINNGVNYSSYVRSITENVLEDKELNDENYFNVVYIGAIRKVNNVGNILDVAKKLKEQKDIRFLIYGDGNELEELKNRVLKENINNVYLKGRVEKKYIPYILSKSSLNLLNYSNKLYNWSRGNSSNKLFEYMASGKPIISTVKMGYCILEKYKCGYSLENNTPEEFAKKIIEVKNLNSDTYEMMGSNAKIAAQDFDFRILTNKLISIIEKGNKDND